MSVEPESDLDLISRATGLLTIELAFFLVFVYGSLAPTDFSAVLSGFLVFEGPSVVTTIIILGALVGALVSAASTLLAVFLSSSRSASRLIRISAGLLGLAGVGFGLHILLFSLTMTELTTGSLGGIGMVAVVSGLLLAGGWRLSRRRHGRPSEQADFT